MVKANFLEVRASAGPSKWWGKARSKTVKPKED